MDREKWNSRKLIFSAANIALVTGLLILGSVGEEVWSNIVTVCILGYLASQATVDAVAQRKL